MKKKLSGSVLSKIGKVVTFVILIIVLANTILAIFNFRRIIDHQEPVILTKQVQEDKKLTYPQGLFKVVHETGTDQATGSQEITIVLRPFFLD